MDSPTHQDALVYRQYLTYRAAVDYDTASDLVWSEEFLQTFEDYRAQIIPGSPEHKKAALFCHVHETLGVIFKHELIHPALLFDRQHFQSTWDRFEDIFLGYRLKNDAPDFMLHFEAFVEAEKRFRVDQSV